MCSVNTLIKWPGGKTREIKYIENMIPKFDRYIEPFFGGGAMFFYLKPQNAVINDISKNLIDFYILAKEQNPDFREYLNDYCTIFNDLLSACDKQYNNILSIYQQIKKGMITSCEHIKISAIADLIISDINKSAVNDIVLDREAYKKRLCLGSFDKMLRTKKNEQKSAFNDDDLKENLITGFTSGTYLYFRDVYNDILLGRNCETGKEYNSANFYFIREYCYGSMFRYNSKGEFNIPYGGISYNHKDFQSKINEIFSPETAQSLIGTEVCCMDFEELLSKLELRETDFVFLDPPYDTDFSDYEGRRFAKKDQQRLAETLKGVKAKFILISKNTDFICSLYENDFNIFCFNKTYSYNVRSRNERNTEHLIITNMAI